MTNTLERLSSPTGEGNVWRRIGALVIDWAVIAAGVCVFAAIGYGLTGGQIRMAQAPLSFTGCVPVTAVPEGFDPTYRIPGVSQEAQTQILGDVSTFQADVINDCRTHIMGSEINRNATIQEAGQTQRYFILPVDRDFRVVRPWLYLDHVFGLAMLLVLTLLEGATGTTFGKRVTGLRVRGPSAGRPGLGRALVRNLVIWGPGAALGLIGIASNHDLLILGDMTGIAIGATGLAVAFGLWPLALLVGLIASGARPFWDQIAGVRVVRA
jgi:uncharacterized RDD family membrane protein YckC